MFSSSARRAISRLFNVPLIHGLENVPNDATGSAQLFEGEVAARPVVDRNDASDHLAGFGDHDVCVVDHIEQANRNLCWDRFRHLSMVPRIPHGFTDRKISRFTMGLVFALVSTLRRIFLSSSVSFT